MSGVIERVEEFLKSEMWKEKEPGVDDVDLSFNDKIDEQKRDRLIHGEKNQGVLDLNTDPRDFIKEGVEELIDFLNYIEFAMLQGKVSFCKWVSLDKDLRFLLWRLEGRG